MESFRKSIDDQINTNKGINLLCEINVLQFSQELLDKISAIDINNHMLINSLADYAVSNVLKEMYRVNQYYNFDEKAKQDLKSAYIDLYGLIKQDSFSKEELEAKHYERLKVWLKKTNPFAGQIYPAEQVAAETTACFEYSPLLQIEILQIDLAQLEAPVLDIGCGQNGNLVRYFRKHGIEAFGIDRYDTDLEYMENSDWLAYDFGVGKWGTIISNLGFSNHFLHHHLRSDGDYISYATKYMQILGALKTGGKFHYAPSLPFIEQYLDDGKYILTTKETADYRTSVIQRL